MRNFQVRKPLQIRPQHLHLGGLRLANNDSGIDTGQQVQRLLKKLDRAGAVEKSEAFVEKSSGGAVDFHTQLPRARFGAGISDRVLLRHRALACDGLSDKQDAFQQRRLAATIGSHQGHTTWPAPSVLFGHCCRADGPLRHALARPSPRDSRKYSSSLYQSRSSLLQSACLSVTGGRGHVQLARASAASARLNESLVIPTGPKRSGLGHNIGWGCAHSVDRTTAYGGSLKRGTDRLNLAQISVPQHRAHYHLA